MLQHRDLVHERPGADDHAIADQAFHARMQDAGRDQVQYGLSAPVDDGVPGVVAALKTRHGGRVAAQQVHNLALALIAPLRAQHNNVSARVQLRLICHVPSSNTSRRPQPICRASAFWPSSC